jgi:hypothetical protein
MKCERFQLIAGGLARNEIMDSDERACALAHAAVCERCEQVLTLQSRLSEGFRSLAQEAKAAQAPSGVENKLLAAFRERIGVPPVTASPSGRPFWISAVAAVLLLAVGILGWRWYFASVPQQTERAGSQSAAATMPLPKPETSRVVAVNPTQPPQNADASISRRTQSRRHSMTQATNLTAAKRAKTEPSLSATTHEIKEVTTAFVPLGYGSALDLQDGGQMVRVELPRSALTRFGLPMNMNRADEKIKADVLVGADGLARAIRFVQPIDESTTGPRPQNERNEQ